MIADQDQATKATPAEAVANLRSSLSPTYPEIDVLYSDAYLESVLSVPDRTYEYARDEKIAKALEWRREYGVDALIRSFVCDEHAGGIFRVVDKEESGEAQQEVNSGTADDGGSFVPSQSLVDVCQSGTFRVDGFDDEGRIILQSRTALMDWWTTGVEDGIRYHVLVIEHALAMIKSARQNKSTCKKAMPESMVLLVDTTALTIYPPPLGALTGMVTLLQRAYPDRIHRIYVGPVSSILRGIYDMISPYMRPRSRDKIRLLACSPNQQAVTQEVLNGATDDTDGH